MRKKTKGKFVTITTSPSLIRRRRFEHWQIAFTAHLISGASVTAAEQGADRALKVIERKAREIMKTRTRSR